MNDSSRTEIRVAGFGGQGIVLCGVVLGRAACIYDGMCATVTQSYGPEARGGACAVQIVLRDKTIGYPYVTEPDILAVMSQEAAGKFVPTIRREGMLICEEDLVKMDAEPESVVVHRIPARRLAEELGQALVQNIVMAGFITATSGVVSADAVRRSVCDCVPRNTEEINLRAFEAGYEYARRR